MKRVVAFVGVESHFVFTKSSGFFIEALRTRLGKLAVFTSEWKWIHLPRKKHWDLIVFWQHFPMRWELDCLDADSVVLVPMLDDCPKHEGFWKPYNDCTVLCFSTTLGELISGFGLRVIQAHYYPAVPTVGAAWNDAGLRGFFWPRKPDLNWSHVRPLVRGTSWERFHVHRTDKLSQVPLDISNEEKKRLPLTTSGWFESPQQYSKVLSEHNVFFAPRRYEGIGLSFLEAMSLGMAVVAPDNPTMNEYIRSGESGYLYDPDKPEPPDWKEAKSWGEAARAQCISGHDAWLNAVPSIIDSFLDSYPVRARAVRDSRRAAAIVKAWPGYIRYRLIRLMIVFRNHLRRLCRTNARPEVVDWEARVREYPGRLGG